MVNLPTHAILRAIPDKLMGVLAMGGAIISFMALPVGQKLCAQLPIPLWKWCVWIFVIDFFVLMYCGAMPRRTGAIISLIGTVYWSRSSLLVPGGLSNGTILPPPRSIHQNGETQMIKQNPHYVNMVINPKYSCYINLRCSESNYDSNLKLLHWKKK